MDAIVDPNSETLVREGGVHNGPWPVYRCAQCGYMQSWAGSVYFTSRSDGQSVEAGDKVDEYWCQTCGFEQPLPDDPIQTPFEVEVAGSIAAWRARLSEGVSGLATVTEVHHANECRVPANIATPPTDDPCWVYCTPEALYDTYHWTIEPTEKVPTISVNLDVST